MRDEWEIRFELDRVRERLEELKHLTRIINAEFIDVKGLRPRKLHTARLLEIEKKLGRLRYLANLTENARLTYLNQLGLENDDPTELQRLLDNENN